MQYDLLIGRGNPPKCGTAPFGPHVCFGSLADIRTAKGHVCFAPESGHVRCTSLCLLWANSGHCIPLGALCSLLVAVTEFSLAFGPCVTPQGLVLGQPHHGTAGISACEQD
jgi:hypothetical protein